MPPFIFLHGMWGSPVIFDRLRAELAAVGLKSCAPALPRHDAPVAATHDESDNETAAETGQLRLGDYVAAVKAGLAAEDGPAGDGVIIVGHSLGGLLAQLVAADLGCRQVKGLVLLATAPSAQTLVRAFRPSLWSTLAAMARPLCRWGWWRLPLPPDRMALEKLLFHDVPAAETEAAFAALVPESGAVLAQIMAPLFDRGRESRVDYDRLTMPALLISGAADRVVPPAVSRATARRLTTAGATVDYEEWPDVGHWLFHDAVRPRLAAALARFAANLAG